MTLIHWWLPKLGNRLVSFLHTAAGRWKALEQFLSYYHAHTDGTQAMMKELVRGIPPTQTTLVEEKVWVGIYEAARMEVEGTRK